MSINSTRHAFGGRYAVLDALGSGGMADVYLAHDQLLDREVAVKALRPRFSHDPYFIERFRREARIAARLSHPNIVALYDYGASDGSYFIVMEHVKGQTLSNLIATEGALEAARAAEIASFVATALRHAHRAGLVHRDITSSNVMVTASGEIKVSDFGIAKALQDEEEHTTAQPGTVIGTAAYLSPEQAQGKPIDARSDIYSLGIVLFEMLTARTPFLGETPLAVAYQHVVQEPATPSAINPLVPGDLDALVLRALAKDPQHRFKSADILRDELERFLTGKRLRSTDVLELAVASVVMEAPQLQRPRAGVNPMLVALSALFAAIVLAGGWLALDALNGGQKTPDLVGRYWPDAHRRLTTLDLRVQIEHRYSSEPSDFVLGQEPEAGVEVLVGDTIHVVLSDGTRPGLAGMVTSAVDDYLERATLEAVLVSVDRVLGR